MTSPLTIHAPRPVWLDATGPGLEWSAGADDRLNAGIGPAANSIGRPCRAAAFQSSLFRYVRSARCGKVDSAEGMATLEAMSSHHNFRPGQRNKLVSEPPIAAPDEHAQLVEADQRFRAALGQAIAAGGERIEAVEATVQLKRRTKLPQ
jgi:hypothetical protein